MNFLMLISLAVFLQSVDADTEKVTKEKPMTVVRVTTGNIEIGTTQQEGKMVQERAKTIGGILVVCESLKLSVTEEGKVFECEGCSFTTPTGVTGTAPLAVFDLAKGIVILSGDETTQVKLVIHGTGEKVEQTLVTKSIEMSVPHAGPHQLSETDDSRVFYPDTGEDNIKRKPQKREFTPNAVPIDTNPKR